MSEQNVHCNSAQDKYRAIDKHRPSLRLVCLLGLEEELIALGSAPPGLI